MPSSSALSPSSSSRMINRPSALTLKPWSFFLPCLGPGWVASEVGWHGVMAGQTKTPHTFLPQSPHIQSSQLRAVSPCTQVIHGSQPLPTTHEANKASLWAPMSAAPCSPSTRWATLGSRKLRGSSPPPSFSQARLLCRVSFRCSLFRPLSSSSSSSSESAKISSMLN